MGSCRECGKEWSPENPHSVCDPMPWETTTGMINLLHHTLDHAYAEMRMLRREIVKLQSHIREGE